MPDLVFKRAERLARSLGKSRSQLYAEAIAEYVARHSPDEVTEQMDRVCAQVEDQRDAFRTTAARRLLRSSEW